MKNLILLATLVITNQLFAQTFNKVIYNSSNSGLPHNHIRSISIDSNDIVWVGGLARFDGTNWTVWNTTNSNMPANNVRLVKPLANGEVWFSLVTANNDFPYTIAKLHGNNLTNWNDVIYGSDFVDAFNYYSNKVWLSTLDGLYINENNTFSPFNATNDCITPVSVSDILFDTPSKYWMALSDYSIDGSGKCGLLRIDQNNCTYYDKSNSSFPSDNVTLNLRKDKNNPDKIWLRTNAGIVSFDGTNWEIFAAPGTSLPNFYAIDSFGVIWTYYNFHGFQNYDGTWHSCQNLISDEITDLAIDSHNNLWAGTYNSGLIKLERVVTSVPDIAAVQALKCYPTILGQELFLEQDQDRTLSWVLMDINSKVIMQEKFIGHKATISLAGYKIPAGVYFYCFKNTNNDILQTGKLLKTE